MKKDTNGKMAPAKQAPKEQVRRADLKLKEQ